MLYIVYAYQQNNMNQSTFNIFKMINLDLYIDFFSNRLCGQTCHHGDCGRAEGYRQL